MMDDIDEYVMLRVIIEISVKVEYRQKMNIPTLYWKAAIQELNKTQHKSIQRHSGIIKF